MAIKKLFLSINGHEKKLKQEVMANEIYNVISLIPIY